MTTMTHEHVQHQAKRIHSLTQKLERFKERFAGTTEKVVRTLEVGTGALVGGVVQGKAGPDGGHIMHVPIDLGVGLVLNVLGYVDAAGKDYSQHLNNFGDGFVAAYLSNLGFGMGNNWRTTGKLLSGKASAALPAPSAATTSGSVSPEQMSEIMARVAASRAA